MGVFGGEFVMRFRLHQVALLFIVVFSAFTSFSAGAQTRRMEGDLSSIKVRTIFTCSKWVLRAMWVCWWVVMVLS